MTHRARCAILSAAMAVLIGQPIDARELEQATSQWTPERFASMCNDLVWAVSGRQFPKLPSFTERVNAADGGIDAEWEIEVADINRALPTPIVGPGWNVFQYKKRDLIAQDRRRIFFNLKSNLKGTLARLVKERQKTPARYILFLNVDLKHDQTLALKNVILEGCKQASEIHIEVIGAAEIAAFLNNQPHLRAAYFAPLAFKTWEEANRSHRTQKLFGFDVALIGREDLLTQVRSLVDNPRARVVVVAGLHDIGKSRLVLEATSHRPHEVVFALDPRSMQLNDYRNLGAPQHEVICVVEDPEPDSVQKLANEILAIERLKLIITVPTSDQPLEAYGTDERIQSLAVGLLSDEDSRKLLAATGKRLDFGVESWILDHAGGNPGILLKAARIAEQLREAPGNFEAAVGQEFERRIEQELGGNALKCVELLSPLTHVGISGRFETELRTICDIFGDGLWKPARVFSDLEGLEKAGLVKRGGSFAEISIPFLANHLVTTLLRGRKDELFALFARLDESGRVRLIRRLSQVTSPEVSELWDAMFDPHDPLAPFGTLPTALKQPQTLKFLAGAAPEKTVRLFEEGLLGTSHEERLALSDDPRRELMWALEQLVFRAKTSRRALKLIWLLAEAENEKWGNNATGVLSECFHPLHSQMPLPLDERLAALRECTSPQASNEGRLIAIRAASKALASAAITLRHSTGVEPLGKWPVFTRPDAYDYARDLVDHFLAIAETEENEVADEALKRLPRLIFELGIQGQPKKALERFEKLVKWAKIEKRGLDVFALFENIEALRQNLQRNLQESEMSDVRKTEFDGNLSECNRLKGILEEGSFSIKLKRWTGGWSREDHEKIMRDGRDTSRSELELTKLAKEAVSNPTLLSKDLVSWLLSASAQNSPRYFFLLGIQDFEGHLRSKVEEIGSQTSGAYAFSAYWGGWAKNDRTHAEKRLVELASKGAVSGEAFVSAAGYLGPSEMIVANIRERVSNGLITPKLASGILYGDWVGNLSAKQFLSLLTSFVGSRFEHAALVVDIIGRWLHRERSLDSELKELAWQCLEAAPSVTEHEEYNCQRLAARLAESNTERGLRLLEKLLTQPHDRHAWNPIDRYAGGHDFWNVLHGSDRRLALRTVFTVALQHPLYGFRVTWNLEELLNQAADADILLEIARETESHAIVVAKCITIAKEGFWPIAFGIIENFPTSQKVWSALTQGVEQMGRLIEGSYSQHIESCRSEVEKKLSDPTTPTAARPWLQDILGRMGDEVAQHVIWEYDEDANDLRRYIEIEDKTSPERIWAISRVLKYADWKDIRRMLTVEDIEDVLPQVDLPERKRKALEKALEVWRLGS